MNERDYQKRGQALMATVFGVFVFLMWQVVSRMDFQDCLNLGVGC